MTRIFTFIGVSTGQSSIVPIFPLWRGLLDLGGDVELVGLDLPLHARPERYRAVVERIKHGPDQIGALVTTHKIDLYQATHDLFDVVDEYARLCGEVSAIGRRPDGLLGWATDPISAGRALDRILGPRYFGRTGGHVLCLGAGGAGVAITLHLITRQDPADRPSRIVVTNRGAGRLRNLRALHAKVNTDVAIEYVDVDDSSTNDRLMASLPSGSVVINATGLGKDSPGSPLSDGARFPDNGNVWEINYRGELRFLHQALAQRESRGLRVEDGWEYFIFGWAAVMEKVFDRSISDDELAALSELAEGARPPLPTNSVRLQQTEL